MCLNISLRFWALRFLQHSDSFQNWTEATSKGKSYNKEGISFLSYKQKVEYSLSISPSKMQINYFVSCLTGSYKRQRIYRHCTTLRKISHSCGGSVAEDQKMSFYFFLTFSLKCHLYDSVVIWVFFFSFVLLDSFP